MFADGEDDSAAELVGDGGQSLDDNLHAWYGDCGDSDDEENDVSADEKGHKSGGTANYLDEGKKNLQN